MIRRLKNSLRRPALLAFLAGVSVTALSLAQSTQAAVNPPTSLGLKMREMAGAFRTLSTQVADATLNASSLQAATTLLTATEGTRTEIPAKADTLSGAERAAFVAAYEAKIDVLIVTIKELQAALLANDNTAAVAAKDKISTLIREGHGQFR